MLKKTGRVILWLFIGLIVGPLIGLIALISVALLCIKYWPLPPVPPRFAVFSITDMGNREGIDYLGYKDPIYNGWRLTESGSVERIANIESEANRRKTTMGLEACRLGIDVSSYGSDVHWFTPNRDTALVTINYKYCLFSHGKKVANIPLDVQGYRQQAAFQDLCRSSFFKVNSHEEVIGNDEIATACASSGGTSEPHGRLFPVLWRRGHRMSTDLNSLVSRSDGWYLEYALDLNERGQILCVAVRTDERGAEHAHRNSHHLVVLTPHAAASDDR